MSSAATRGTRRVSRKRPDVCTPGRFDLLGLRASVVRSRGPSASLGMTDCYTPTAMLTGLLHWPTRLSATRSAYCPHESRGLDFCQCWIGVLARWSNARRTRCEHDEAFAVGAVDLEFALIELGKTKTAVALQHCRFHCSDYTCGMLDWTSCAMVERSPDTVSGACCFAERGCQ